MKQARNFLQVLFMVLIFPACNSLPAGPSTKGIITGAQKIEEYRTLIEGKAIAIVANQTSMAGNNHLVDTLHSLGMNIKAIFAPEHGFRNLADAGEKITDGKDPVTGLPIISLYGGHLKPTPEDLSGIDIVIFDIQDVGTRFYTYISTLSLVEEACAENNKKLLLLDRPNPNGFYFDGNILDTAYSSFVGMHPVPVAHGMTPGEYAAMANGEGWLKGGVKCDLTVIKCDNWDHSTYYELPIKPSPNIPNQTAVYLYPSLCFFEGTVLSCGRGTDFPFQVFGGPEMPDRGFSFTPKPSFGAQNPLHNGAVCHGTDLRNAIKDKIVPVPHINLGWVIGAYRDYPDKENFFKKYFDTLAGGPIIREQIIKGMTADQIYETWKPGLETFGKIRAKYLLYK
jgi:uncharacterized protein YbbC (DUF1343 family)